MYAVIFEARIKQLDKDYLTTAERLRKLAQEKYGCIEFTSLTENNQEIAISYWDSLKQIQTWKQDPEHLKAQTLGKERWYESYRVRVVEVVREYSN